MKTLFHNPEINQINWLDSRFYEYKIQGKEPLYFPSVTTILDVYPKGFGFNQWLKDVGGNATQIVERAAEQGSKIHAAVTDLVNGNELKWEENYSIIEWEMILKFSDFWKKCNPKLIANELTTVSPFYGFAGTKDLIVDIGSKRWLLDVKTSNYLHKTHELQVSAYAYLWNELNPSNPINETGILWLKSSTRTDKIDVSKNIYQGQGWQIKTFDRDYHQAFKIFQMTHNIWKEENPNAKPANMIYPDKIKL